MKNRNILIAATLGVLAGGAFAVEATQYNPEQGGSARADVNAEALAAKTNATVVQYGEATVFVDRPAAEGTSMARTQVDEGPVRVVRVGDATDFVDQPGVLTRSEVRAETLAALRAGR